MLQSAVVDASVLVSAFLFPNSIPGRVVIAAEQGLYKLHFSPILIEEAKRSLLNPRLKNKYKHTNDGIEAWCNSLHRIGNLIINPLPDIGPVCRDPDDDHVIAAALLVRADCIVTGDQDLLDLLQHQNIRIMTARQFLDEIKENL